MRIEARLKAMEVKHGSNAASDALKLAEFFAEMGEIREDEIEATARVTSSVGRLFVF